MTATSAFSLRGCAARGSWGSSCRSAAAGWRARSRRRGSASRARGSRCGASCARAPSRAGRRRSARVTSASISSPTNQASVSRRTSACSSPMSLRTSSSRDMLFSAIVVLLSSFPCNGSDDCAAHGGRLSTRGCLSGLTPHYGTQLLTSRNGTNGALIHGAARPPPYPPLGRFALSAPQALCRARLHPSAPCCSSPPCAMLRKACRLGSVGFMLEGHGDARRGFQMQRFVRRLALLSVLLLLAGVIAFGAAACGSSSGSSGGGSTGGTASTPKKGGTLVFGWESEPNTLDPAIAWNLLEWQIFHNVFANFYQYAAKPGTGRTQLVPNMATAMPTITNGGKTYTIHLKPGAQVPAPGEPRGNGPGLQVQFRAHDAPAPCAGHLLLHERRRRRRLPSQEGGAYLRLQGARQVHGAGRPDQSRPVLHQRPHAGLLRPHPQRVGRQVGQHEGRASPARHRTIHVRQLDAGAGGDAGAQPELRRRLDMFGSTASSSTFR